MNYAVALRAGFEATVKTLIIERQTNPAEEVPFYLTLELDHPEVQIPAQFKDRNTITFSLQHQYKILTHGSVGFSAMLWFNQKSETVFVPWGSITRVHVNVEGPDHLLIECTTPSYKKAPEPEAEESPNVIKVQFGKT